jgi:hypothetical protein
MAMRCSVRERAQVIAIVDAWWGDVDTEEGHMPHDDDFEEDDVDVVDDPDGFDDEEDDEFDDPDPDADFQDLMQR